MVKRALLGCSNQSDDAIDEQSMAKLKLQTLLNEFLGLQKEYVSKKRKLQTAKLKKDNLLAKVRFLRRRCKNLLKMRSLELEVVEKDTVQLQSSDMNREVLERVPISRPNSRDDEEEEQGRVPLVSKSFGVEKYGNFEKRLAKKKISWQDQVLLKV